MRHTPKGHSRALQLRTHVHSTQTHSFPSRHLDVFLFCVSRMPHFTDTRTGRATKASSMQIRAWCRTRQVPPNVGGKTNRGSAVLPGEWVGLEPGQETAHIKYIPGPACRPRVCASASEVVLGSLAGWGGGAGWWWWWCPPQPGQERLDRWDVQAAPVELVLTVGD